MLPAMEVNFSNEFESATLVAQKAKSCYSYLRAQPLMIWGWLNSRQKIAAHFSRAKFFLIETSLGKNNFEDPASGGKIFLRGLAEEKINFERPCRGKNKF